MKILVLSNMYPKFMGGTFIHTQIKHLMNLGCGVEVIAPAAYCPGIIATGKRWNGYTRIPKHATLDSVNIYHPRYFRLPGKWFHPLSCYTQYAGLENVADLLVKRFKPDVIHAHSATAPGFIGLLLKNKYGLPLICSLRGSDINTYPHYGKFSMYLTRKVIAEADRLISVSTALKDAANLIEQPKKEIEVIYNGCDSDMFAFKKGDRDRVRDSLGIHRKDKVVIFVGSISRSKGIFELIKAYEKVCAGTPGLHLFLVGNGPEEYFPGFENMHTARGRIHQLGHLPQPDIARYLNAADIFVLPSHSEGVPNVILEAMACSLPVIATKVGGIPEIVKNGITGYLIEKGDPDALASAIGVLIRRNELAKNMGCEGRKIIENNFQWERNAKRVLKIYEEVALRQS